jgi:stalled ribosome rescue protein Dom34
MNKRSVKQYAGVWMDTTAAVIISNEGNDDYKVQTKVGSPHHKGGGSEHSMNNAKANDTLKFFKSVSKELLQYDEILVFGPGNSQEQFRNHLKNDFQFNNKPITIDSSDQLTDPQVIAKVRDFFGDKSSL